MSAEEITEETLLNMGLHDVHKLDHLTCVRRVIGGWIYITYAFAGSPVSVSAVFVPEPK
jgi:hypothetical protein